MIPLLGFYADFIKSALQYHPWVLLFSLALPFLGHFALALRVTGLFAIPCLVGLHYFGLYSAAEGKTFQLSDYAKGYTIFPQLYLPIIPYAVAWWRVGARERYLQRDRFALLRRAWRDRRADRAVWQMGRRFRWVVRREHLLGSWAWLVETRENLAASRIVRRHKRQTRQAEKQHRINAKIAAQLGYAYTAPAANAPGGPIGVGGANATQPVIIVNQVPRASSGILRGLVMRMATYAIPLGLLYLFGGSLLEIGKRWASGAASDIVQETVRTTLPPYARDLLGLKEPPAPQQPPRR